MTEKPEKELTIEHIFPDAIGGNVTIKSICKPCNDYLGRKVDTHLTNHYLVQFARMIYKIPGKSGVIPNPLENGFLGEGNTEPVKYRFTKDGNPKDIYVVPEVNVNEIDKGMGLQLKIDKSDEYKVPEIINKILKRKGFPLLSNEEIEKRINRQYKTEQFPMVHMTAEVDMLHYQRAILKIVYELAYYWLGEKYLEDETAIKLRQCILDDLVWEKNTVEKFCIEGKILIDSNNALWEFWKDDECSHLAFINVCDGVLFIGVRVFNNISGIVTISKESTKYFPFTPQFLAINPVTKETRNCPYDQELLDITRKSRCKIEDQSNK